MFDVKVNMIRCRFRTSIKLGASYSNLGYHVKSGLNGFIGFELDVPVLPVGAG